MRDPAKNGRATLAWSLPLLLISSGFARIQATEHSLTLSQAAPRLLTFGLIGAVLTVLARVLDDGRDNTFRILSGYAFAITSVATMTMLTSLVACLCIATGRFLIFTAVTMLVLGAVGVAISVHVIVTAAKLRAASVLAGMIIESIVLGALLVIPHPLMTYAVIVVAVLATLYGLVRLCATALHTRHDS